MKKVELLAPARNLEELELIIEAGADSIYIDSNFEKTDIKSAVEMCHDNNKKIFFIISTVSHKELFEELQVNLNYLQDIKVDAVIASDPGVINFIKENTNLEIHLNYQSNVTNYETANFWYNIGVKAINLSSELSLEEIKEIKEKTPNDLTIESFVHGNISISHSGRQLLTNYVQNKLNDKIDNNKKYYLNEEKRPGEYYPLYEDKDGTYIFNSKELCTIEHVDKLIESGIDSFKIEGRLKSTEYITTIIKVYKMAIEQFYKDSSNWKVDKVWIEELKKHMSEDLTIGFYINEEEKEELN